MSLWGKNRIGKLRSIDCKLLYMMVRVYSNDVVQSAKIDLESLKRSKNAFSSSDCIVWKVLGEVDTFL